MNYMLRQSTATDTLVRQWHAVSAVDPSAFIGKFSSDRLKAFKTRFSPSSESLGQKLGNVAVTLGIYGAVAVVVRELSTANLTPLLHALHLNAV